MFFFLSSSLQVFFLQYLEDKMVKLITYPHSLLPKIIIKSRENLNGRSTTRKKVICRNFRVDQQFFNNMPGFDSLFDREE